MEQWKQHPEHTFIEISESGDIRYLVDTHYKRAGDPVCRYFRESDGYYQSSFYTPGDSSKQHCRRTHRLVAEAWHDNPYGLPQVNHKNGNKIDNRPANLEWCTQSDNMKHAYRAGLQKPQNGSSHVNAKLDEDRVRLMRNLRKFGGCTVPELAKVFGVSEATVSRICNRKRWRHVA